MGQNRIAIILFSISFFIIVALLCVLSFGLLQTSWTFSYIVEPIDIINIIVTFLASVFVAWYVTKRLSEERFDKELMISDLRDVEICMKKILELYEKSTNNNEILVYINQLHILIIRFSRTVDSSRIEVQSLERVFWSFYAVATDYDSIDSTNSVDVPSVHRFGDDLILEVRRLIRVVNTK